MSARLVYLAQDRHFEWRIELDEVRNGMGSSSPVGRPRGSFFLTEDELADIVEKYCLERGIEARHPGLEKGIRWA